MAEVASGTSQLRYIPCTYRRIIDDMQVQYVQYVFRDKAGFLPKKSRRLMSSLLGKTILLEVNFYNAKEYFFGPNKAQNKNEAQTREKKFITVFVTLMHFQNDQKIKVSFLH